MDVKLNITGVNRKNVRSKLVKAMHLLQSRFEPILGKSKMKRVAKEQPSKIQQHIITKYYNNIVNDVSQVTKGIAKLAKANIKSDDLYKIDGLPVINAASGQFLTKKQWNEIYSSITQFLQPRLEDYGYQLADKSAIVALLHKQLLANGSTLDAINPRQFDKLLAGDFVGAVSSNDLSLNDFPVTLDNFDRTAEFITNIDSTVRYNIKDVIRQATQQKWSDAETSSVLFDRFSDLNRDWDRIVQTESSNVFNNAYLEGEVASSKKQDATEAVYFKGKAQSTACAVCLRDIDEIIVKWVDEVPSEEDIDDAYATRAIWSGKTSMAVTNRDSYAVIPRHPHCHCRWVKWYPPV